MIELNNIRLSLGLSWNEFYLCYFVQDQTRITEFCPLSRNQIADNLGVSKQAIIDLVKKLDRAGYLVNDSTRLKCTDKWSRNFTEAREFSNETGQETLPESNSYGKETLPLSNTYDKDSLPVTPDGGKETLPVANIPVKKVDHYTIDSGKETLPPNETEVKILYQQHQEFTVQNQETVENLPESGQDTLPADPSGDLYILNNNINNISKGDIEIEKGCGEKQKPYELTFKDGIATCEVLRASCKKFHEEHPDLYPLPMYTQFIRYWSAPDKKNVPKWYKEQTAKRGTWHLPGRLVTWHENDLKFNSKTYNGKSTQRGTSTLRPTSIAEPSKRTGAGNVAHVEF